MQYPLFYILLVLSITSCTHAEKEKEEQLYKEVMAIHDEVMPQMGEVMRLEKALAENIDQYTSDDSTASPHNSIEHLTTLKQNLSDADEAMMDWMRTFNTEMDTMSHEEKIHYLQEEKGKIQAVKEQINTAIQDAKEALD